VPTSGPGKLRKWERRFALSAEYGVKALYAGVIGFGTGAAYDPDEMTRRMVVAGWGAAPAGAPAGSGPIAALSPVARLDRGYTVLEVPRYTPFRDALLALADRAGEVRIAEIAGSELVTFTGTAPRGWVAPARASSVVAYATPDDAARVRALLRVQARDLLEVLRELRREGRFDVDHIYDY